MLLISGGKNDPNLAYLADICSHQGLTSFTLYIDSDHDWKTSWSLNSPELIVDGIALNIHSIFIRWDVFSWMEQQDNTAYQRANAWYETLYGWALAHPNIKILNRLHNSACSKPANLKLAQHYGLSVPQTFFSNDYDNFKEGDWIIKPVEGGAYTKELSSKENSNIPFIIQEKLINPEMRIYRIGQEWFAFKIQSEHLDYRIAPPEQLNIEAIPVPDELQQGLQKLTEYLKLDYAAADFKTCPKTGVYKFLEINSMPMFCGFDVVTKGELANALLNYLTKA